MIIPYYTPSNICNICKDRSQYLFLAIKLYLCAPKVCGCFRQKEYISIWLGCSFWQYENSWHTVCICSNLNIAFYTHSLWPQGYLICFVSEALCRVIPLWCSYLKEFCFSIDFLLGKRLGFLFTRAHHKISSQSAK